jgi:hypothetical protein
MPITIADHILCGTMDKTLIRYLEICTSRKTWFQWSHQFGASINPQVGGKVIKRDREADVYFSRQSSVLRQSVGLRIQLGSATLLELVLDQI